MYAYIDRKKKITSNNTCSVQSDTSRIKISLDIFDLADEIKVNEERILKKASWSVRLAARVLKDMGGRFRG